MEGKYIKEFHINVRRDSVSRKYKDDNSDVQCKNKNN